MSVLNVFYIVFSDNCSTFGVYMCTHEEITKTFMVLRITYNVWYYADSVLRIASSMINYTRFYCTGYVYQ